jgi:hypothetical protein
MIRAMVYSLAMADPKATPLIRQFCNQFVMDARVSLTEKPERSGSQLPLHGACPSGQHQHSIGTAQEQHKDRLRAERAVRHVPDDVPDLAASPAKPLPHRCP